MKLLIAEDEIRAREGLVHLIPPIFNEVRAAGNGQDALAIALEMQPDVVLCDVRMPKMNGIELARQLRLRFPDVHLLFISAYSDKEYLKSAISIQADGYLEKPIDEQELLDYLGRITSAITARSLEHRQNDLGELFARQQLLRILLQKGDSREESLALNPSLTHAVLYADHYLPVSIRMQWPGNGASTQYGLFSEIELAEMLFRISQNCLFSILSESQIGVLFYGDHLPSAAECRAGLVPVLKAIREANPQVLNVCACIGDPCDSSAALYNHYHASHLQVLWMCFAGEAPLSIGTLRHSPMPPEDRSSQFETLLRTHQLNAAKQLLWSQTNEIIKGGSGSIEQARQYYELLLSICLRVTSPDHSGYRATRTNAEIMNTFSKLSTLPELCRFICVRIDDISPSMRIDADSTSLVREVQDFIRQNLSDPALSVQAIADKVGLSENYLSAQFKRETGQTLHKVIVDLRIERAKYLLLNHYRMPEVAQRCGFSSAGYFHSVFKKHTGLSPAAFVEGSRARAERGNTLKGGD
ncbi:MAG: response regulator [Clostridia bacterium]|nr:response regulator [Clostridia bacterium]